MKLFNCVLILSFLALSAQVNGQDKLNFSFYITSSCGDTVNFVRNQLTSAYNDFRDSLNIEFISWGKSVRESDGSVTCQFGVSDCIANRIQACSVYYLRHNQDAQMDYITCEMNTLASIMQSYSCVTTLGLNETNIRSCVNGILGDALEVLAEHKTSEIVMTFVPTIVYDHVYSAAVQNLAYADFRGYVCSLIPSHSACQTRRYLY